MPSKPEAIRDNASTISLGQRPHRLSKQRTRNTSIELALRSELHRRGIRFRIHRRPISAIRRTADILFAPAKVAVFVHGCFWHGCFLHRTIPATNAAFWRAKIERNRARDLETIAILGESGWLALEVWEHETSVHAADRIQQALMDRRHELFGLT